jgi:hypothetical protein
MLCEDFKAQAVAYNALLSSVIIIAIYALFFTTFIGQKKE